MRKTKMLAALLAGLITLSLAGCGADKANDKTESGAVSTESGITATVTDKASEPTAESSLPADSESKSDESTAEKEKEISTAPADSGKPETAKPADTEPTAPPKQTTPPRQTSAMSEETESTETTVAVTEAPPKSIYDPPFDIEQIQAELIAAGESMGMRHRTVYRDGTVITPDNSSWELPIFANASFGGNALRRSLYDYVTSYGEYELYGSEPIIDFTIYVKQTPDGYEFYFLH
mgnify:CR=1 FL=1